MKKKVIPFPKRESERTIYMKKETAAYVREIREIKTFPNSQSPYDQVVSRILQENEIVMPPISVAKIAKKMNFDVFTATFKDPMIAGIMVDADKKDKRTDSNRFIVVNKNSYATRSQFTIAHEIGHFVLHCTEADNFYERYMLEGDEDPDDSCEKQANKFAAALLMPIEMFKEKIIDYYNREYSIKKTIDSLCKNFLASETAVRRRLKELGAVNDTDMDRIRLTSASDT